MKKDKEKQVTDDVYLTLKTGNLEKEVHIRQRKAVPAAGSTLQLMPTENSIRRCMKSIISALRAKWMKC